MDYITDLYTMRDTLEKSLKEANDKIRDAGGKLSPSDLDYVNKLTHSIKSVETTIAMKEAVEDGGSYDSGSYRSYGYSRDDRGGYRDGASYDDGGSYARGRGRNAMRDSMGRYSSRGYSRDDGYSNHGNMIDELKELMADAPDERTRQEMQRLISKMEQR